MTPSLFAHPFSSYCQKVLVAFAETGAPFTLLMLSSEHPDNGAALQRLWPLNRFPVLQDADFTVVEATVIIEYMDLQHRGRTRMVPQDPRAAIDVRMMDRIFDNYVMTPMQTIVSDALRPPDQRDTYGVEQARRMLDVAYDWLDGRMRAREWAAGEAFSLADCAAAPALFYSDWVREIPASFAALKDYRARLLARPSVAKVVDDARRYRGLFPLGDPGRD